MVVWPQGHLVSQPGTLLPRTGSLLGRRWGATGPGHRLCRPQMDPAPGGEGRSQRAGAVGSGRSGDSRRWGGLAVRSGSLGRVETRRRVTFPEVCASASLARRLPAATRAFGDAREGAPGDLQGIPGQGRLVCCLWTGQNEGELPKFLPRFLLLPGAGRSHQGSVTCSPPGRAAVTPDLSLVLAAETSTDRARPWSLPLTGVRP